MKLKIRDDEDHTFKVGRHTYHWDGNAILHGHSNAAGIGWRKIGKAANQEDAERLASKHAGNTPLDVVANEWVALPPQ